MKQLLLALFVSMLALGASAQNVQFHYDFGKDRKLVTTTVEMFRPDKYGSTFFFIDLDYSSDARDVDNGVSLAYWEIARAFKWNENQTLMPRVEYNGGTMKLDGVGTPYIPIENCWLAGLEHTFASADFSKILTLQANYKHIQDKEDASFQLTAVWTIKMLQDKLVFTGFADFWKEEMFWGTDYRFLTEPQLWYNFCPNFAVGSEIEISNNFVKDGAQINPTLAVKYTF
ncbi:DUF5020 family protein [Sunxiuqinia elliptica]|uniref:Uncharacterized protein DUF5020 n=1 Tax=Sunxiuqinia elliptica TaxID=655355 RepID=A0A4R6H5L6_9BACT|nr:DUF5020 family protein [Sunxiuqinia elliptica]TDO02756.1 uncharacterized protein DUF5020 [Sunxiuqinia elliptica]TDO58506.1 uncharacterized protein DUF5020 [Sunxiuqinia elliptica]